MFAHATLGSPLDTLSLFEGGAVVTSPGMTVIPQHEPSMV